MEKVECKECGRMMPMLAVHVFKKHGMSAIEYMEKYPGAKWASDEAMQVMETNRKRQPRAREELHVSKVFPGVEAPEDATVECFPDVGDPLVPKQTPHYVFPSELAMEIISILEKPSRNNIWISGPTGSGKTELAKNLAAVMRMPFYVINGSNYLQRSHVIGKDRVRAGQVFFQEGIVLRWLRNGGLLLINEYDTLDPDLVNDLKPCLEDPRYFPLPEDPDNSIQEAHPDCRIIVTSNTKGLGDDTGMYVNTNVQSVADLRRFHAFFELDYPHIDVKDPTKSMEFGLLTNQFPEVLPGVISKALLVVNHVREAYKLKKTARTLSTAELVTWIDNYQLFMNAHHSARISFLTSYDPTTFTAVKLLVDSQFGSEDKELLANEALAYQAKVKEDKLSGAADEEESAA